MDNVLNLSTFGEIIPKRKDSDDITFGAFMKQHEEPAKDSEDVINLPSHIAYKALMHTAQLKLFHWQTKSYAEHKALDEAFESLIDLTDGLMESTMGKYGRPDMKGLSDLSIKNYVDDGSLLHFIQEMKMCYDSKLRGMFSSEKDSELLNILDEIIAMLDKTIYLLTLK